MNLHVCEVTTSNWRSIAALHVAKEQEQFIESNAFSLAESQYEDNGISVGLYDEEIIVGYAMYGWYCEKDESIWLDRFMIDENFQGKGYAKRFLRVLIDYLQQKYHCKTIYLTIHPENNVALKLYESFGFNLTDEVDDTGSFICLVMEMHIRS